MINHSKRGFGVIKLNVIKHDGIYSIKKPNEVIKCMVTTTRKSDSRSDINIIKSVKYDPMTINEYLSKYSPIPKERHEAMDIPEDQHLRYAFEDFEKRIIEMHHQSIHYLQFNSSKEILSNNFNFLETIALESGIKALAYATGINIELPGFDEEYVYISQESSVFPVHTEDLNCSSINLMWEGTPKIWFIVDPKSTSKFRGFMTLKLDKYKLCRNSLSTGKYLLPSPIELDSIGIKIHAIIQCPGDLIYLDGDVFHFGYALGHSLSTAVNYLKNSPRSFQIIRKSLHEALVCEKSLCKQCRNRMVTGTGKGIYIASAINDARDEFCNIKNEKLVDFAKYEYNIKLSEEKVKKELKIKLLKDFNPKFPPLDIYRFLSYEDVLDKYLEVISSRKAFHRNRCVSCHKKINNFTKVLCSTCKERLYISYEFQ